MEIYKTVHWKRLLVLTSIIVGSTLMPVYVGIGLWSLLKISPPAGEIPTVMAYWAIGAWTIAGAAAASVILSSVCWGGVRLWKYIYN